MTTIPMEARIAPEPQPADPEPGWTRRHMLRALGLGGATTVVAGTGGLSYRVYDTAALSPGRGDAYNPWKHWARPDNYEKFKAEARGSTRTS